MHMQHEGLLWHQLMLYKRLRLIPAMCRASAAELQQRRTKMSHSEATNCFLMEVCIPHNAAELNVQKLWPSHTSLGCWSPCQRLLFPSLHAKTVSGSVCRTFPLVTTS
jgi:hypothetical protein